MVAKLIRLCLLILLTVILVSCGEDEHIRLGKEWMELGKYDEAIDEFMIALKEEPKSEEVRYLLAKAYLDGDSVSGALKWRDELITINSSNKNISVLDKSLVEHSVKYFDENKFYAGIDIANKVYDNKQLLGLVKTILKGNRSEAANAFNILTSNNSKEVASKVLEEKLLDNNNVEDGNKLRLALFLWEIRENDTAARYILKSQEQKFFKGNKSAAEIISRLSPKYVVPVFTKYIATYSLEEKAFVIANEYLSNKASADSAKILFTRLKNTLGTPDECRYINHILIKALRKYPKNSLTNLGLQKLLKMNLGECFVDGQFRLHQNEYLYLLSVISDDRRWTKLDTWYDKGGWWYFGTLVGQFINRITDETTWGGKIPIAENVKVKIEAEIDVLKNELITGDKRRARRNIETGWELKFIELSEPDNVTIEAVNEEMNYQVSLSVKYQNGKWILYDFNFFK